MTQALLDRVLEPFVECLTREAAQKLVNLRAEPQAQARLDELADKANEGQLSAEERAEYDRAYAEPSSRPRSVNAFERPERRPVSVSESSRHAWVRARPPWLGSRPAVSAPR